MGQSFKVLYLQLDTVQLKEIFKMKYNKNINTILSMILFCFISMVLIACSVFDKREVTYGTWKYGSLHATYRYGGWHIGSCGPYRHSKIYNFKFFDNSGIYTRDNMEIEFENKIISDFIGKVIVDSNDAIVKIELYQLDQIGKKISFPINGTYHIDSQIEAKKDAMSRIDFMLKLIKSNKPNTNITVVQYWSWNFTDLGKSPLQSDRFKKWLVEKVPDGKINTYQIKDAQLINFPGLWSAIVTGSINGIPFKMRVPDNGEITWEP